MLSKMSQNQVPRVASLFAKSGFFIDFQDFLKINLEIMQCQEALIPVLLLFDESSKVPTYFYVVRFRRNEMKFNSIHMLILFGKISAFTSLRNDLH